MFIAVSFDIPVNDIHHYLNTNKQWDVLLVYSDVKKLLKTRILYLTHNKEAISQMEKLLFSQGFICSSNTASGGLLVSVMSRKT